MSSSRWKDLQDSIWRRHANPWSVYTRFAAIPVGAVAIWSRVWIGNWCFLPISLTVLWLVVNPFAFPPIYEPKRWVEMGIYGEQFWLQKKIEIPSQQRILNRWLILVGLAGMVLMAYGLTILEIWPTVFGASIITLGQLWRIDRFSILYKDYTKSHEFNHPEETSS